MTIQFNEETDEFTLKSGKKLYAHMGLLSVKFYEGDKRWELCYGCDSEVNLVDMDDKPDFTKDELVEIASLMLARWSLFKLDVLSGKVPTK